MRQSPLYSNEWLLLIPFFSINIFVYLAAKIEISTMAIVVISAKFCYFFLFTSFSADIIRCNNNNLNFKMIVYLAGMVSSCEWYMESGMRYWIGIGSFADWNLFYYFMNNVLVKYIISYIFLLAWKIKINY